MNAAQTPADLYCSSVGRGEDLVLLHGWGMHSGLWGAFTDQLAQHYRVHCVDLPGHGRSQAFIPLTLDAVVAQLLQQFPHKAHWLGWSLGGAIAMQLALQAPRQVSSLTLISASPHFVREADWSSAIGRDVFEQFATALQQDYVKTLKKFIALQTLSAAGGQTTLRSLQQQLFAAGEPDTAALQQGLDLLQQVDLRAALPGLQVPLQVLLGERDQIVPVEVAAFYRTLPACRQLHIIEQAGHAPFLSHADAVADRVHAFLQQADQLPAVHA